MQARVGTFVASCVVLDGSSREKMEHQREKVEKEEERRRGESGHKEEEERRRGESGDKEVEKVREKGHELAYTELAYRQRTSLLGTPAVSPIFFLKPEKTIFYFLIL
jgi:DNA repair photolyase